MKKTIASILIVIFLAAGFPALAADNTKDTKNQSKPDQQSMEKPEQKKTQETSVETEVEKDADKDADKNAETKTENGANAPFFKAILQDQGHILTSPFHIKGKQFLYWGGTLLVTGLLIANDESIYRDFKDYQAKNNWVDDVSPQITKLGLGEYNLGIAGLFYLGGALFKDKKAKETARLTLMTFVHTGIVVQIGKHVFGRQRPSWEQGKDRWHWFKGFAKRYEDGQLARYDAFPSGHTITIFGTATVIAEMYKKTVWVPVLSYTLAAMCGLSRVTEDTHWLSDVFLGAVLGYAIGKYVVKRRNRLGRNKVNIYPVAGAHQVGLGVQYVF